MGAAASLLIELVQGLLGNGTCHSDDLVRNLAGAVIGAGLGMWRPGLRTEIVPDETVVISPWMRPFHRGLPSQGQVTRGFQSLNIPDGFFFHAQTCSSKNGGMP